MSDPGVSRPVPTADGVARTLPVGFDEYAAARARYFERLRRDSEIWRLERAWRRTPAAHGGGRRRTI